MFLSIPDYMHQSVAENNWATRNIAWLDNCIDVAPMILQEVYWTQHLYLDFHNFDVYHIREVTT